MRNIRVKSKPLAGYLTAVVLAIGISQQAQAAEQVTVFAAASLTNAINDIAKQYQQEKEVKIVSSFASSSTLARQIDQGAPADLFISADQQWMDYTVGKQLMVDNTRYTLLGNELVLITEANSKQEKINITEQTPWASLLANGRLAVGDPDHVPAGIYAKEALQKLGAWTVVEPKLARASDVRAAMALVERDEAPLGIVYGSDAIASKKVKVVGVFPETSHKPVEYPIAIVKGHENPAVSAFYDYLKGPKAAEIFKHYGFTPR
ncbi:molybdate ABC transporter substrate-binding protein [Rouxiella sp. Mn2063]|uniref:molybdate ABC transporter substrate-binding protein n=1 Tax=Rouxiella sp. Mn2063 TaxID=3395262 RepID=UPI003BE0E11F